MSNEKVVFRPLLPSCELDAPIPVLGKRTPAMEAVDRMFLDRAQRALADVGSDARQFLMANPGVSMIELSKRLNRGANALGLIMAVYDTAAQNGTVRETAKDLLTREILAEFPKGWTFKGSVRPGIRVGNWEDEVVRYVHDPRAAAYAESVMRHLAIDHPPPEGWKPQVQDDPLISEIFDRYWPAESAE